MKVQYICERSSFVGVELMSGELQFPKTKKNLKSSVLYNDILYWLDALRCTNRNCPFSSNLHSLLNSDLIESFEIIQFEFNGSLVITVILYFLNRYWVQKKVVGKYDLRIPKKYFLQPSCMVSWFFGLLYYFGEYSLHRRINLPLPSQREYIPAGIHLLYNPYVPPGAFNQMEPNKNKCKIVTALVEVQFF